MVFILEYIVLLTILYYVNTQNLILYFLNVYFQDNIRFQYFIDITKVLIC
jgi:hypothetical protein